MGSDAKGQLSRACRHMWRRQATALAPSDFPISCYTGLDQPLPRMRRVSAAGRRGLSQSLCALRRHLVAYRAEGDTTHHLLSKGSRCPGLLKILRTMEDFWEAGRRYITYFLRGLGLGETAYRAWREYQAILPPHGNGKNSYMSVITATATW